jgi:hypothetical protein
MASREEDRDSIGAGIPYETIDDLVGTKEGRTVLAILLQTLIFEIAILRGLRLADATSRIRETARRAIEERFSPDWQPGDSAEDTLIMAERCGDPNQLKESAAKAQKVLSDLLVGLGWEW